MSKTLLKENSMPRPERRYFNFNPNKQPAKQGLRYPFFRKIDPIVADSISTIVGTPTGSVTDIQTEADGNVYSVAEIVATPAIDIRITFEDVLFFNWLRVMGAYEGSTSHSIIIQLYNVVTALFETRQSMFHYPTYNLAAGNDVIGAYECKVEDSEKYINAGQVILRIAHPMNGNSAHDIHIDYASLY